MIGIEAGAGLAALTSALRSGAVPLAEYLAQLERRFAEWEPRIAAFLPEDGRFERVRWEAEALLARWPHADDRPPLFGVPVGVKDIFRVDGFPTRAGSRLPAEVFAGAEAACVTALKRAGALILGKTVTTEFAYFAPGPTRNPHDRERTPGGSSSGSAAAVTAGLCPLALGTQTIGSTIRPAAFCGIVGFKPTYGRIPLDGVIPLSPSLDHVGAFSADVDGVRLAMGILAREPERAGHPIAPRTSTSLAFGFGSEAGMRSGAGTHGETGVSGHSAPGRAHRLSRAGQARDESAGGRERRDARPVLGVPEAAYLERASQVGLAHFHEVCGRLARVGYEIRAARAAADFDVIVARHDRILAAEAARVHREWYDRYRDLYDPRTTALIERGRAISESELADALRERERFAAELAALMDEHGIDAWVSPAAPGPAPRGLESTGDPVMNLPWTQVGFPTLGLPSGRDPDGLPLGLQVTARPHADETLLEWGPGLEAALRVPRR